MQIIKVNGWSELGIIQCDVACIEVHVGNEKYGLKFLPLNGEIWKLEGISEVNFASDKQMCGSVTGYVIYFMGIPVAR